MIIDAALVTGRFNQSGEFFIFFFFFTANNLSTKQIITPTAKTTAFFFAWRGVNLKISVRIALFLQIEVSRPPGIQDACLILNAYARACMLARIGDGMHFWKGWKWTVKHRESFGKLTHETRPCKCGPWATSPFYISCIWISFQEYPLYNACQTVSA